MQAKDIKPRTWYATAEKYGNPYAILLNGTDRYTVSGRVLYGGEDKRVIAATPDRSTALGRRWDSDQTGYLAVKLTGDALATVEKWILRDEDEQAAKAVMTEAATLLTKVTAAITERGTVPMAEINQDENRARGIHVTLVQGRNVADEYAKLIRLRYEQKQESMRLRKAADDATEQRRQFMVGVLTQAREMGLNTDPSKGGAQETYSSYSKYSEIRMSVGAYQQLVEEIARLRRVVAGTLTADEIGEGGTR